MKTFSAIGLKPQDPSKEKNKRKEKGKEEKNKNKKKKDLFVQKDAAIKKAKEKKKRSQRDLSPISEDRRINKRLLKLTEETSSFSSAEDETSAIAAKPMNAVVPARPTSRSSRPRERGIMIEELIPQVQ